MPTMQAAAQVSHSAAHPYAIRAEKLTTEMPSLEGLPRGTLLMKTVATSICGSDFWGTLPAEKGRSWRGFLEYYFFRQGVPGGTGHEVVAEVVAVKGESFRKPGELLLAMTSGYLHVVDSVKHKFEEKTGFAVSGLPSTGSFAEYFLSYEDITFKVPDLPPPYSKSRLDYVAAQPLGTILHCVGKVTEFSTRPLATQRIAVVGQGQNGLLMTAVLKRMGCNDIVVMDKMENRLEVSKKVGATEVHKIRGVETKQELLSKIRPVDVAIEMVGHQGESLDVAARITKDDGVIVVFGLPCSTMDKDHTMQIKYAEWARNVKYISSHAPPLICFERALELLRTGWIDLSFLFTHKFSWSQFEEAYGTASNYKDGVVKTLVTFPGHEKHITVPGARL